MTQFSQIELLFNQYLNSSKEIDSLIQDEKYEEVMDELKARNKLVKKIFLAKKTATLTEEQKQKLDSIEQQMEENEKKHISSLKILHKELGEKIKNTKGKIKINDAYSLSAKKGSGLFVDLTE